MCQEHNTIEHIKNAIVFITGFVLYNYGENSSTKANLQRNKQQTYKQTAEE